jgi:hypothetical protein
MLLAALLMSTMVTSGALTRGLFSLPHLLLNYLLFMQLFAVAVQHNETLSEVFHAFRVVRYFNGNVLEEGDAGAALTFASCLLPKLIALVCIVALAGLLSGFHCVCCCASVSIYPSTFIPLLLAAVVPLGESLFSIYLRSQVYVWSLYSGLVLVLLLLWALLVRGSVDSAELRRAIEYFVPRGRGAAGLCYRPQPESFVTPEMRVDEAARGSRMQLLARRGSTDSLASGGAGLARSMSQRSMASDAAGPAGLPRASSVASLVEADGKEHHHLERAGSTASLLAAEDAELRVWGRSLREDLRATTSRWKLRFHVQSNEDFERHMDKVERHRSKREQIRQRALGKVRNTEFDEAMAAKQLWMRFPFRPLFETVVFYSDAQLRQEYDDASLLTDRDDRNRANNPHGLVACAHRVRTALALHMMALKLVCVLTFVAIAVSVDGALGMGLLVGCVAVYLLLVILLAPYRNPFMQIELVLTSTLLGMLLLFLIVILEHSAVSVIIVIAAAHVVAAMLATICIWRFKEAPPRLVQEFVLPKGYNPESAVAALKRAGVADHLRELRLPRGLSMRSMGSSAAIDEHAIGGLPSREDLAATGHDWAFYLRVARVYWDLGGEYRSDRRYAYAYAACAAKLAPEEPEPLALIGHYYREQTNLKKAARFYKAALKRDAANDSAGPALLALLSQVHDDEHAVDICRAACARRPCTWASDWLRQQGLAVPDPVREDSGHAHSGDAARSNHSEDDEGENAAGTAATYAEIEMQPTQSDAEDAGLRAAPLATAAPAQAATRAAQRRRRPRKRGGAQSGRRRVGVDGEKGGGGEGEDDAEDEEAVEEERRAAHSAAQRGRDSDERKSEGDGRRSRDAPTGQE